MGKTLLKSMVLGLCLLMFAASGRAETSLQRLDGYQAGAAGHNSSLTPAPSAGEGDANEPLSPAGFTILVDLSSSMRHMAPCNGMVKEEAVATLLRKINRRLPNLPYTASLRVFGYKQAWTRDDYTTLYFGPAPYNAKEMEWAISELAAADSISPFASALDAADNELKGMGDPKAVLMFADFEPVTGSGDPVHSAANEHRRYGRNLAIYTFYVSRHAEAPELARDVAQAGGGQAYDICRLLEDEAAFEKMMMDIFGPGGDTCPDYDGDGVCDQDDLCPNTPAGVPVDGRGCWIAAYSQFFDFDKAVVKSAYLPRIRRAAEVLNNNPGLPPLIVAGYTDNVGTSEYNLDLGRRRAEAVKELLVEYGVSADRLRVESFGETRPITTNETEEGRARNRRVEFHVGEVPARSSR